MRNFATKRRVKQWARVAAKLGLLLTDSKIRAAVADQLQDRVDDVSKTVAGKYDDAVGRLEDVATVFQPRSYWPSRVGGFLVGVGVGAGLGILLAPAAGRQTRQAVRDKAVDVKNTVVDSAATVTGRFRQPVASMPFSRTEG
jgi:hypothetical protein